MSKQIKIELDVLLDTMSIRMHNDNIEKKAHTYYCIVNRFIDYFNEDIIIDECLSSKSHFGCDFLDYEFPHMISEFDYKRLLNEPCTYYNRLYDKDVDLIFDLNATLTENGGLQALLNENLIMGIDKKMCRIVRSNDIYPLF